MRVCSHIKCWCIAVHSKGCYLVACRTSYWSLGRSVALLEFAALFVGAPSLKEAKGVLQVASQMLTRFQLSQSDYRLHLRLKILLSSICGLGP